jgi:phosphatidylserine synthase 2
MTIEIKKRSNTTTFNLSTTKGNVLPEIQLVQKPKSSHCSSTKYILFVSILCMVFGYLGMTSNGEMNMRNGILGLMFAFLAFGSIYMPDSYLRRPHPIIWRFLLSAGLLFTIIITFLLFQDRDFTRQFLRIFDRRLGTPLIEKVYGDTCSLSSAEFPYFSLKNVYAIADYYLIAHFTGWYVKMLIVRDFKLCWVLSILFEIQEITFQNWFVNFAECWWDTLLFDVFGCNALGIYFGSLTIDYFDMKRYNWFTNEKGEWKLFTSLKEFLGLIWFLVFINLVDMSHFFLKHSLWIPPNSYILFIRINMWAYFAIICTREYYEVMAGNGVRRFYQNITLAHFIIFIEVCLSVKFSEGLYTEPFSHNVRCFWSGLLMAIIMISIYLGVRDLSKHFLRPDTKVGSAVDRRENGLIENLAN